MEMMKRIVRIKVIGSGDAFLLVIKAEDTKQLYNAN